MVKVNEEKRIINLSGNLDNVSVGEIASALLDFISEDDTNYTKPDIPIKIYINSYGGNPETTFGIADIINCSSTPIYTYAYGSCQSAATILFLAGDERYSYQNTNFMMHKPFLNFDMNASRRVNDLESDAERISNIERQMKNQLIDKCNIPKNIIKDIFKKDKMWYPTISELKKYNIVDKIL